MQGVLLEIFNYYEVRLAINKRYNHINKHNVSVEEMLDDGSYVDTHDPSFDLLSNLWLQYRYNMSLNFTVFGQSPFYLDKKGENIYPVCPPPECYSVQFKEAEGGGLEFTFRLNGQFQPKKWYWVKSNRYNGIRLDGSIDSEISMLVEPFKRLRKAEIDEIAASKISLQPRLILQNTLIDPIGTLQEEAAKLDAELIRHPDDPPLESEKKRVRVDNDGFIWLPRGYVTASHQLEKIDVSKYDSSRLKDEFKQIVERCLCIPPLHSRSSTLNGRSASETAEALTDYNGALSSICYDEQVAIAIAYHAIYKREARVKVNYTTRLPHELISSLHDKGIITTELLLNHVGLQH